MMYREVPPHPRLRKYIKCLWMLGHDYGNSSHDHEHLWADVHTELIFTSGERYLRKPRGKTGALPASFVIGPFQNELQLFCNGRMTLVAARFWPWGFGALSTLPAKDLKNTVRSAQQALGDAFDSLDEAVAAGEDADAKLANLEQALLTLFASAPKPKLLSRPIAIEALKSHGVTRIGELQRNHGMHARQLERAFVDEIGVSAKVFCRIVRFNHAKSLIEQDAGVDLRTVAYECGYADQAHFTRNFREMFGITPAAFKARMKDAAKRSREQRPDVVFLQDEHRTPG